MGVLSDESAQSRLVWIITGHQAKIRVLLFVFGVVGMAGVAHRPEASRGIGVHENAMAVGIAGSGMTEVHRATINKYIEAAEKARGRQGVDGAKQMLAHGIPPPPPTGPPNKFSGRSRPVGIEAWAALELKAIGLDVHTQRYSVIDPITGSVTNRTNLYAIHWARRSDLTESLLLHTSHSIRVPTTGAALAVGLTSYFASLDVWSKNIVVLITPDTLFGVDAFLSAYNEPRSAARGRRYIVPGLLPATAGQIHSAISLSFRKSRFTNVVLRFGGINAQKPNLDLINAAIITARRSGVKLALGGCDELPKVLKGKPVPLGVFAKPLAMLGDNRCALREALAAVSCEPDGAHGAMLQHDIPAVTLADAAVRGTRKISEDAAVATELLFRAFNNMSQRFNQCYYFYFFVDCANFRFVPVSHFIGPVLAFLGGSLIAALALWHETSVADQPPDGGGGDGDGANAAVTAPAKRYVPWSETPSNNAPALLVVGLAYGLGAGLVAALPRAVEHAMASVVPWIAAQCKTRAASVPAAVCELSGDEAAVMVGGLQSIASFLVIYTVLVGRIVAAEGFEVDWRLVKCFTYILNTLCLATVAALNAPLAVAVSLLVTPLNLAVPPAGPAVLRWIVAVVLSPPLVVAALCIMLELPVASTLSAALRNAAWLRFWHVPVVLTLVVPTYAIVFASLFVRTAAGKRAVAPAATADETAAASDK